MIRQLLCFIFIGAALFGRSQQELYPIAKNGKWGLVNFEGDFICKPIFNYIEYADKGQKFIYNLKGKKGLVGLNGLIITEPIYEDIKLYDATWSSSIKDGKWKRKN